MTNVGLIGLDLFRGLTATPKPSNPHLLLWRIFRETRSDFRGDLFPVDSLLQSSSNQLTDSRDPEAQGILDV
jgi:hypothetical protein